MTIVLEHMPAPAATPPSAIAPSTRTAWDPVTFRMSEVITDRSKEIREEGDSTNPPPGLPDPRHWAASMAKASVECLLGLRPPAQLTRWLHPPLHEALARRAGLAARIQRDRRPIGTRLVSAHVQEREDGGVDATVSVFDGTRVRAAALLLEVYHGRWLVTSLEIG